MGCLSSALGCRIEKLFGLPHELEEGRDLILGGLAGSCLGDADDIDVPESGVKTVGLNTRGKLIPAQLDNHEHDRVQTSVFELCDRLDLRLTREDDAGRYEPGNRDQHFDVE